MPRRGTRTERGYGLAYQKARAYLLMGNPSCYWCGAPATTADHEPPLAEVGRPHLNLVPACKKCNFGRGNSKRFRHVGPSRDW